MSLSKRRVIILVAIVVVSAGAFFVFSQHGAAPAKPAATATAPKTRATTPKQPDTTAPEQPGVAFDKDMHSINKAISLWVVVNKQRPLNPADYRPDDLVVPDIPLRSNITSDEKYVRADNARALKIMVDAAEQDGIHLNLQSGFRSYQFQVNLYNLYVKQQGKALADSQSARPGHSEHQTGLAADLGGTSRPGCNVEECFADTEEGKWLAANAYKYGYIIRYPKDKTSITGYTYEPWHLRYVGTELSEKMHQQGIETLEEFFGLPAAPDYN